jgi:hypothetical protein
MALSIQPIAAYYGNNSWKDSSGNQPDISPDGMVINTSSPFLGSGDFSLDGVDDRGDCGTGISTSISGDFSLSAWVKMPADTTTRQIIGNRRSSDGKGFEFIGYNIANGSKLLLQLVGGVAAKNRASTSAIRDGTFHHVVGVRTSGVLYVYVDSVREDGAYQGDISDDISHSSNCYIGHDNANPTLKGKGNYDAIYIFDGALTQDDVDYLFNGGPGREILFAGGKSFFFFGEDA